MGKVNLWLNWNVYLATDNNSANEPHLFLVPNHGSFDLGTVNNAQLGEKMKGPFSYYQENIPLTRQSA